MEAALIGAVAAIIVGVIAALSSVKVRDPRSAKIAERIALHDSMPEGPVKATLAAEIELDVVRGMLNRLPGVRAFDLVGKIGIALMSFGVLLFVALVVGLENDQAMDVINETMHVADDPPVRAAMGIFVACVVAWGIFFGWRNGKNARVVNLTVLSNRLEIALARAAGAASISYGAKAGPPASEGATESDPD